MLTNRDELHHRCSFNVRCNLFPFGSGCNRQWDREMKGHSTVRVLQFSRFLGTLLLLAESLFFDDRVIRTGRSADYASSFAGFSN